MSSVISFLKQSAKSEISDLLKKKNQNKFTVSFCCEFLFRNCLLLLTRLRPLGLRHRRPCDPLHQVFVVDVEGHNHEQAEELAEKNGSEGRVDICPSLFS